jgi:hypothetical protein
MKRALLILLLATCTFGYYYIPTLFMGTVTASYAAERFACDGSTTTFTFSFPIKLTSDLDVYLVLDSAMTSSLLTETTHYTLSATNNDYSTGGTITTVSTYASGYTIVAVRNSAQTQDSDFQRGQGIPEETLENILDRQTMNIQDLSAIKDISIRAPVTDDAPDMELPNSVDRASKFLAFDANGDATTSTTTDTTLTSFGTNLVTDTNFFDQFRD